MSAFVEDAFTDPNLITGDTTPGEAVEDLRLTGEALTVASANPVSLTMATRALMPANKTPVAPYIERLWADDTTVANRVVGTRKKPYLRAAFTGYARLHYQEAGVTYTQDIHRTYVLFLTRNTQNKADLNEGETYTRWRVAFYKPSVVEFPTPPAPVPVTEGDDQ